MTNVVFMGTPEFAVPSLKKLVEVASVVGVVTQPDRPAGRGRRLRPSPVKTVALDAGVPVYQPKSLRTEEAAAPLREWTPDIIVVAAFGQILRAHVLDLPPRGCVNVHASLLPRWRGASPIHHAVLYGDSETGVCLMQMERGLDTGPVYASEAVPIGPHDTTATLHDRLAILGAEMLGQHLEAIVNGDLAPVPQDDTLATYAPMIDKEMGRIAWEADSAAIERRVRAMTPWPGAFTGWDGEMLRIKAVAITQGQAPDLPAGTVVEQDGAILVKTGDGLLRLKSVQLAGKRPAPAADFAHGRPHFIGSVLSGP